MSSLNFFVYSIPLHRFYQHIIKFMLVHLRMNFFSISVYKMIARSARIKCFGDPIGGVLTAVFALTLALFIVSFLSWVTFHQILIYALLRYVYECLWFIYSFDHIKNFQVHVFCFFYFIRNISDQIVQINKCWPALRKNTVISPNFLVYAFYGKSQFPHSFDSTEAMRILCLSAKLLHQEIRWNYGILRSAAHVWLIIHEYAFYSFSGSQWSKHNGTSTGTINTSLTNPDIYAIVCFFFKYLWMVVISVILILQSTEKS